VAVKIKLKRLGKIHAPQYRIVVADSRTARNGRAIEEVGVYQPLDNPSVISVDSDRIQYWLGVGAQPTEAVTAILKVTGDWQKFKGLPGAEGSHQVTSEKQSKMIAFEAAVKSAADAPTTTRKKPAAVVETVEHAVAEIADAVVDGAKEVSEAVAEVVADVVEAVGHVIEDVVHPPKDESAEKSD
jgi:small subunit ribosomal protein S16